MIFLLLFHNDFAVVILCSENTKDRRNILIRAARADMMQDYVYFLPDHLPSDNVKTPWLAGDELDEEARGAYEHVFQVRVRVAYS